MPPTRVASTGRPAAIASRIEYGRPSQSVISANASQSASCSGTSLAMAEQRHAIAEAERIAMPLDLLAVGAVAEHAQLPGLAARLGERVEQRDQVLGRRESRSAAEHEAAAVLAVRRQRGGRVDAVVDDLQAAARRDAALARELQVVARHADDRVGQGRNRLLAGRVDGARGAAAPRERPAMRSEDGARPQAGEREPGQHAGLGRVDLHDVRREPARQRAQLAYGRRVVERMRIAYEVADVVERDIQARAGVGQRSRPVRGDLDLVALAQARHERGREGLRTARLGERHDHEQPGRQWGGGSVSMASHCGREPH